MQVLRRTRPVELRDLPRRGEVALPALAHPTIASPLPALRREARPLGGRLLTLATGLAAAIPVLSSTVDALRAGWVPTADRAIIATRALDVLTSHSPLVGQYSEAGRASAQVLHSPGPMLYWLLAPAARWGTSASLPLTMGIVNTLAILATVALARRRGGPVLMFAAAVAIALMCQSLATEDLHDMWNPAAGLFPFLLLILTSWSLACGEYRLLPVVALVASFVTQTHLMYVLPTAVLLAIGLAGLAVHSTSHQRRSLLGWGAAALVVAALCWSAPAIDEIQGHPGNLTLVARTAIHRGPTLGARDGWTAVVHAVGVRPWWLHTPASRWSRKYDVTTRPSAGAVGSAGAILAALIAVALLAAWRGRRDVALAAVIALALCAALGAEAAATPQLPLLAATLGYTMWWGSIVGMWAYLVLAWALGLGLAWVARRLARGTARARTPPAVPALAAVAAGVVCVAATAQVGLTVAADARTPDEHAAEYAPTAQVSQRLSQIIPRGQTVDMLPGALDWGTMPIKPGVRYYLQRHGDRVLGVNSFQRLGDWYELRRRPYAWVVDLTDGTGPPRQGVPAAARASLRLAVRSRFSDAWGVEVLSVWVARVPAAATSRTPCDRRCPPVPAVARGRRR